MASTLRMKFTQVMLTSKNGSSKKDTTSMFKRLSDISVLNV